MKWTTYLVDAEGNSYNLGKGEHIPSGRWAVNAYTGLEDET